MSPLLLSQASQFLLLFDAWPLRPPAFRPAPFASAALVPFAPSRTGRGRPEARGRDKGSLSFHINSGAVSVLSRKLGSGAGSREKNRHHLLQDAPVSFILATCPRTLRDDVQAGGDALEPRVKP